MGIKKGYLKQIKGITFAAKSDSNHWVIMDGSESAGGSSAGSSPKELVLMGLAGCTGSDVVSILEKKKVQCEDFEINMTADVSEDHPKIFKSVHLEFVFYGSNIPEKDVERAIELSQTKYCSVTKMLEKTVKITHSFKIINKEVEAF